MKGIRHIILMLSILLIISFLSNMLLAAVAIKTSYDAAMQAERITHQIELMFVKS
jgi:hypothetical protein